VGKGTIGIKIANGSFFPIMEESRQARKRLVLTTVKDNQKSVQIDLYRGEGEQMFDPSYIGSMVIDDIGPAPEKGPNIELIMDVDDQGNLNAEAGEEQSGQRQDLSVRLTDLPLDQAYDEPDFELDDGDEIGALDFDSEEPASAESGLERASENASERAGESHADDIYSGKELLADEEKQEGREIRPLLLITFVALALIVIFLIAFLLFRTSDAPPVPPLVARDNAVSVEGASDAAPVTTAANSDAARGKNKAPPSNESGEEGGATDGKKAASSIAGDSGEGVWYHVQPGDTLWHISIAFYRTPWLYQYLARINKIQDPDLIFAHSQIYIPKK
jgi:hypothetical protein